MGPSCSRQVVPVFPPSAPLIDHIACATSDLKKLGRKISVALSAIPQSPEVLAPIENRDCVRIPSALQHLVDNPRTAPQWIILSTSKPCAGSRESLAPPTFGSVRKQDHAVSQTRVRTSKGPSQSRKPQHQSSNQAIMASLNRGMPKRIEHNEMSDAASSLERARRSSVANPAPTRLSGRGKE